MVKKNNQLDKIKKSKYIPMSLKEQSKQIVYFENWCEDMMIRKIKGNEKYGNYMMKVDDKTSFEEFREEMLDCCNHLIMLTYKLNQKFVKQ